MQGIIWAPTRHFFLFPHHKPHGPDSEGHLDDESTSDSSTSQPDSCEPSCHGSGMFSSARHLIVHGQTLTNITNNYATAPAEPSDFRVIPMSDIDLQYEHKIHLVNETGVTRASVRRVYSAKLDGRTSAMTVAVYQGDGAEEEWRQDIARHTSVRHPNLFQIFGAARSNKMHATIFHGDLIPLRKFLDYHSRSPLWNVYTFAYCSTRNLRCGSSTRACGPLTLGQRVKEFFGSTLRDRLEPSNCTFWIRHSTGQLSVDLVPANETMLARYRGLSSLKEFKPLGSGTQAAPLMDDLTFDVFHHICWFHLSRRRVFSIFTRMTSNLGAIISCSSADRLQDWSEIAIPSDANMSEHYDHWTIGSGETMDNGWTRYNSYDVSNLTFALRIGWPIARTCYWWLSQANHVFSRLHLTSNFQDYVVIGDIDVRLVISATTASVPEAFLFVGPKPNFRPGPASIKWPECPAYWSFDPTGVERIPTDEAARLRLPAIRFTIEAWGWSWDASIYAGLRQFHQTKGFDPDSQDLAQHLGYPLYRLHNEVDAPFAHVDEEKSSAECDQSFSEDDSEDAFNEPDENLDSYDFVSSKDDPNINSKTDESKNVHDDGSENPVPDSPSSGEALTRSGLGVSAALNFFAKIRMGLIILLAFSRLYDYLR